MTTLDPDLSGKRILLIDDDSNLLEALAYVFSRVGCLVFTAMNGQAGLGKFFEHQPDLIILDVMMPVMDGWETCHKLRQLSPVPIIMLTCVAGDKNIIDGLNKGVDDYLVKPIGLDVLLARTKALLRRAMLPAQLNPSLFYDDGYLWINLREREVSVRGRPLDLPPREYQLLAYLYLHSDKLRSHSQILAEVWGGQEPYSADIVHNNIHRLRQKLEKDPSDPRYLLTQPRIGYRFIKHPRR